MGWLVVAAGCGPSFEQAQTQAGAHNEREWASVEGRVAASGEHWEPQSVLVARPASPVASSGAHGLFADEALYRTPNGIAFAGAFCAETQTCSQECARRAEYRFARAPDGHAVVVRIRPVVHAVVVKIAQCALGCGGAPRGQMTTLTDVGAPDPGFAAVQLGESDLARIEVRDLAVSVETVRTYCDHPTPVP